MQFQIFELLPKDHFKNDRWFCRHLQPLQARLWRPELQDIIKAQKARGTYFKPVVRLGFHRRSLTFAFNVKTFLQYWIQGSRQRTLISWPPDVQRIPLSLIGWNVYQDAQKCIRQFQPRVGWHGGTKGQVTNIWAELWNYGEKGNSFACTSLLLSF